MKIQGLQVLIVEDDLSAAIDLEMLLLEIGCEVCARTDNAIDALNIVRQSSPDLLLLDIDLNGPSSGIDLAKQLEPYEIPIVFITSFDNDAVYSKASQTKNAGYLIKPVNKFTLLTTINLILERYYNFTTTNDEELSFHLKDFLFFKKKDRYQKVHIDEIAVLAADRNYTMVQLKNETKFLCKSSIADWELELKSGKFIRVHRSYIISTAAIEFVDFSANLILWQFGEVPIGRSFKEKLQLSLRLIK